jgi:hypothetical protein
MSLSKSKFWYSNKCLHFLSALFNCLNMKIYSYLDTSGGKGSNLYLNIVHFFNAIVNEQHLNID